MRETTATTQRLGDVVRYPGYASNRFYCVLLTALFIGCSSSYREVAIEIPIDARLDTRKYNRVLVATFTTQSNEPLDLDTETVRLLTNQLLTRSSLQVVEAEVDPLGDFSQETLEAAGLLARFQALNGQSRAEGEPEIPLQEWIDLEQEQLLQDEEFWRRLGEEYQNPLIVTGKLRFSSASRSGLARVDRYVRDAFNRPSLQPAESFQERTGYTLDAEFHFVDGETGRTVHRERFTEEVIYGQDEQVSVLTCYFELMDRVLPSFLSVLSPQSFQGTRVLLR